MTPLLVIYRLVLVLTCIATEFSGQAALPAPTTMPHKVLWAWQRPEDLSYIDAKEYGVAYLACHAILTGDSVTEHWRDQPLHVPPDAELCPVLRIDIDRKAIPTLSQQQIDRLLTIIARMAAIPHTAQIQIDFDALKSERSFYRELLGRVHETLPRTSVSITALVSWCLFDNWISDLPVDETVPMLFSLGQDRQKILDYFQLHGDFLVAGCCRSMGLSLEDAKINQLMIPKARQRTIGLRFYIFTKTPWTKTKYETIKSMLSYQ